MSPGAPTWLVVASERTARIFESPAPDGQLCRELERFAAAPEDGAGRGAIPLVRTVASALNQSFAEGRFAALELAAEPAFLAALRPLLGEAVRARVGGWREDEEARRAVEQGALARLEWMRQILAVCEAELRAGGLEGTATSPARRDRRAELEPREWIVLLDGVRVRVFWSHGESPGAPWTPVRELDGEGGADAVAGAVAALVRPLREQVGDRVRVIGGGPLASGVARELRMLGLVE